MKKNILLIMFFFLFGNVVLHAANEFEARVISNEKGYLEFQIRCIDANYLTTTTTPIGQISFEIRWPTTNDVDIEVLCSDNFYTIGDGLGARKTKDTYYWRNYVKTQANPVYTDHDWVLNQWETIVEFKATSNGSGTTVFEVAPSGWVSQDLVWGQGDPVVAYHPNVNGSVSNYAYPTLVYNYVWKGGSAPPPNYKKWNVAGNWTDECSNTASSHPWGGDNENVFIPGGLTNYPEQTSGGDDYAYTCNYLLIGSGAHIVVPDLSAQSTNKNFIVKNDAIIKGQLILPAKGYATIQGVTKVENSEGVLIQADATGVGSFIDNGTITYAAKGGSAKVQTFLANSAAAGQFHIHLVGPTVDEQNYTGSGQGAFLSAFNIVPGATYAYEWDETNGWQNLTSSTYEVQAGSGIALSSTDAADHTLEMVGELMTGDIVTKVLSFGGNNYQLVSNPYPSSIDFESFATGNSQYIQDKYWIWDKPSGNYITRANGSGGQENIQVGQAFFVSMTQQGQLTFKNDYREHSSDPFRNVNPYELTMNVKGGDHGYQDQLIVRFVDDAGFGYDPEIDAEKWHSMYEDATMISSNAEDGTELAINFLPLESLQKNMVSVPVNFYCGYDGNYQFDFSGMDTFNNGNEIWLEDKEADKWIDINENPVYSFSAVAGEINNRFELHFFGPTGVQELSDNKTVDIYSWKRFALIKNNTDKQLQTVLVYNLGGKLIKEVEVSEGQKMLKVDIPNGMGYYIVKAIVTDNVFTNKVLIEKY